MNIKLVRQEEQFGCAIACIAMVLNRSYESVAKDWKNDFSAEGIELNYTLNYLGDHGFGILHKQIRNYCNKDLARDEMLRPFAPVHLVSVQPLFDAQYNHLVVMTDKGKLLCPHGETDEAIRDSYAIIHAVGLYKE